jgi:hypothetical protein
VNNPRSLIQDSATVKATIFGIGRVEELELNPNHIHVNSIDVVEAISMRPPIPTSRVPDEFFFDMAVRISRGKK